MAIGPDVRKKRSKDVDGVFGSTFAADAGAVPGAAAGAAVAVSDDAAATAKEDAEVGMLFSAERHALRRKTACAGIALAVVLAFSLCVGTVDYGVVYSPVDVVGCYVTWFKLNVIANFVPSMELERAALLARYPMYFEVLVRVFYTFVTLVCGVLLAISGMLYQNAFRNPIAAPTMLGVSSGISLGYVAMVMSLGSLAASATYYNQRFVYCFVGGIAVLVVVFLCGRLTNGRGSLNMINVMLVATIVSSVINSVVNFVVNNMFSTTEWSAYYDISNATDLTPSATSLVVLLTCVAITCLPVYLYRFQLNVLAFGDEDMRMLGVSATRLRLMALVCGSLMVLVAQTFVGSAAMASLVVPFVSRALFGSEFRRQALGNVFIGATLLLVCRILVSFIPFVGDGIPLGSMVSLVTLPAFAWVMVAAQKQWND